ncbi:beta-lactamase family protein [Sphingomonas panacisoli]|uniref:Beta-lactamase family protein n=2 Tax=Sphingomonas panacisoli TaxID=1813879 RepID=A0A5B8LLC5_9SPHN|nr:beta-lactamase family protein [Sphingomonas panacisoli]
MLALLPVETIAQTAPPPAAVAAEQPEKLASGVTFTVPAEWSVKKSGKVVELTPAENDLHLVLVDIGEAADAKAAVAAAWAAWNPSRSRPPKLVTPRPARNGWEERQVVDYETSPNEKRVMTAVALRSGKVWTVAIIDGFEGTAEKRGAALSLVSQSLRPAGYARESFAGRAAAPMDAAKIAELRAFVEDSMKKLGIPGASFALTDRQRTIYSTGLGVRMLGQPTPVDADSEFAIASNTKGLVTLMLAKLADEGKLRWDEPVTEAYPPFKLGSAATTSKVLIRHLICACTGLPRKDMQVLLNSDPKAAAADAFAQLAATEPTSGFGEVFQYNNLMAAAAGYIGGHLIHPELSLDAAFYRSIDEKVLNPLGMTATTFDFDRVTGGNWARPHSDALDGNPAPILDTGMKLNYAFTRYAGAGGAWSTANDLIKYVRFELNEGKLDNGTQYVTAKNLLQRRVPNVPIGEDQTYGMGLEVDKTWGVTVVHHGGSLGGYKSDIIVIPEAGIGAVLLTNSGNGQLLLRPFMRRLLEIMYGGKPEAAADVASSAARIKAELAKERERVSVVPDAAAVAALAPKYYSTDLGPLTVTKKGSGVTFAFRTFSSVVGTRKNDDGTISFVMLDPTLLLFPLVVGSEGGKPSLIVRDSQHEFKYIATK